MYTIKINGQIVSVNKYKTTVAKSVKVSKVAFDFDESWDNLSIFACFRNANIKQEYTVQMTKPYEVDIPWEVLSVAGKLEVGALGLNDGGIVKPTIWCTISDIVNGVSTDGIESAEPTPEIVVQITETADKAMDVANDAHNIAMSVKQSADAGLFNGKDGVSPIISINDIDGGHQITIIDGNSEQTIDVMDGSVGKDGVSGTDGKDGVSPTFVVSDIANGHRISITDANGVYDVDVYNGKDGYTPIKGVDYFDGKDGIDGEDGTDGKSGVYVGSGEMPEDCNVQIDPNGQPLSIDDIKGLSAYEVALQNGFGGTEAEWIESLHGASGKNGNDGIGVSSSIINNNGELIITYTDGHTENLGVVVGSKGDTGANGYTPIKGTDYFTEADKQEIVDMIDIPTIQHETWTFTLADGTIIEKEVALI